MSSPANRESVHDVAWRCLQESDVAAKLAQAAALPALLQSGLTSIGSAGALVECIRIDASPRVPRVQQADCHAGHPALPELVQPGKLPRRGLGTLEGRAAFVHAIAHIEFNAINLACDAVFRFRGLPIAYYRDWLQVAADEARHFSLLSARLADFGHSYGDFDAHNGLWEMAEKTAHSCLERMALVPRVLEARGLDVTPGMIERLQREKDIETVEILQLILREEVAHVAAGTRWYHWCCEAQQLDPVVHFRSLLARFAPNALRGPINQEARLRAGFDPLELEPLADCDAVDRQA